MAKSIRSKVKKRLRSVKRTVIKKQRLDPASKLGEGGAKALEILQDAKSGHLRPRVCRPFPPNPARKTPAPGVPTPSLHCAQPARRRTRSGMTARMQSSRSTTGGRGRISGRAMSASRRAMRWWARRAPSSAATVATLPPQWWTRQQTRLRIEESQGCIARQSRCGPSAYARTAADSSPRASPRATACASRRFETAKAEAEKEWRGQQCVPMDVKRGRPVLAWCARRQRALRDGLAGDHQRRRRSSPWRHEPTAPWYASL